jgi:hypothetical protein
MLNSHTFRHSTESQDDEALAIRRYGRDAGALFFLLGTANHKQILSRPLAHHLAQEEIEQGKDVLQVISW